MDLIDYKDIDSISWYNFERTPTFNISWHMTDCCNYNCSYCFDKKKQKESLDKLKEKGLKTDIDETQLLKTADYINNLLSIASFNGKVTTIHYTLIGGEVSLLGDKLLNIINILSSNNSYKYTFNITTNLSYSYDYYKSLIDVAAHNDRITKFVILGSYHSEFTNKETYSNKLIKLKQYVDDNYFNNIILRSSIVIRTDNFEEVKWLSAKLGQVDIYQSIRRQLKDDKTVISYPTEISEWINNHDKDYLQVGVRTVSGETKKYPLSYIKEVLLSNKDFNTNNKLCVSNALQIRGDELRDSPCQSRNLIGHVGDNIDLGKLFYKEKICELKNDRACSFCSNFEFSINGTSLSQNGIIDINNDNKLKNRSIIFRLDQKDNDVFNESEIINIIKNYPVIDTNIFGCTKIIFRIRTSQFSNFIILFNKIKEIFKNYNYLDISYINFVVDTIDDIFLKTILLYDISYRFYITYDNNINSKIDKLKYLSSKIIVYVSNTIEFKEVNNLGLQNIEIYPVDDSMDNTTNNNLISNTEINITYNNSKLSLPYYRVEKGFNNYDYYINCNRRITIFYDKLTPYIRVGSCCCNNINSFSINDFLVLETTERFKDYISSPYILCTNKNAIVKHIINDNTCIKKNYIDERFATNITTDFLKTGLAE